MRAQTLRSFWPLALIVLGVALRGGFGLAHPPQKEGIDNTDDYVFLATSLARTGTLALGTEPSAEREPAYPVYLALFFKSLGRSYATVLTANCLCAALGLWLVFLLGRRLFGEVPALLALALYAVYPQAIYYAAQPRREVMMATVGLLGVWSLLRAWDRGSLAAFALAGAAGALGGLTNTTFLPFQLIVAPLALFWLKRGQLARGLRWIGIYLAVLVALYASWPLRNYVVFKTWILGSTAGSGTTFYKYLVVPIELGGTQEEDRLFQQDPNAQVMLGTDKLAVDKAYWRLGLEWVRHRPWAYAKLVARRFAWGMWRPVPFRRAYGISYDAIRWTSLLTDAWIIPLGFAGMACAGLSPPLLFVYLFFFSLDFSYSLMQIGVRYRFSFMPWLILFAAFAACRLSRLALPAGSTKEGPPDGSR